MGPNSRGRAAGGPRAQFVLDSHHLAILDRFVAHARRQARREGRAFAGIVIEIDPTSAASISVADYEPLELG
jgi:hypothetical protein